MKAFLFFISSLVLTSANAADWSKLQRYAEHEFLTQNEITFSVSRDPLLLKTYSFHFPINKVEVNGIDNPAVLAAATAADFAESVSFSNADRDYVEIYLHTDAQVINCYARFDQGRFSRLDNCRMKEGSFGTWVKLQ